MSGLGSGRCTQISVSPTVHTCNAEVTRQARRKRRRGRERPKWFEAQSSGSLKNDPSHLKRGGRGLHAHASVFRNARPVETHSSGRIWIGLFRFIFGSQTESGGTNNETLPFVLGMWHVTIEFVAHAQL